MRYINGSNRGNQKLWDYLRKVDYKRIFIHLGNILVFIPFMAFVFAYLLMQPRKMEKFFSQLSTLVDAIVKE